MKLSKGFTLIELFVVIVIIATLLGAGSVIFYPMLHRYTATGTITGIAEMKPNITIGQSVSGGQYSFAVDITTEEKKIVSFSSEDRKFATCEKGQKVKVAYFKYPPWNLSKAGTFYGGRMLQKYAQ